MKKYLTLLLLVVVSFSSCKKKPEDVVADVKKKCNNINGKLKDLTMKRTDDLTNRGGGTITGYFKDDDIKKIIAEHFTDTCRTFIEYYFDDGMLIFVQKQNYVYNRPMSYTEAKAREKNDTVWYDDKKTKLELSSFYFNKNKMIRWINIDNHDVQPGTPDFTDMQSVIWAEAVILLKQLKEE